jgi:hypothetical protein
VYVIESSTCWKDAVRLALEQRHATPQTLREVELAVHRAPRDRLDLRANVGKLAHLVDALVLNQRRVHVKHHHALVAPRKCVELHRHVALRHVRLTERHQPGARRLGRRRRPVDEQLDTLPLVARVVAQHAHLQHCAAARLDVVDGRRQQRKRHRRAQHSHGEALALHRTQRRHCSGTDAALERHNGVAQRHQRRRLLAAQVVDGAKLGRHRRQHSRRRLARQRSDANLAAVLIARPQVQLVERKAEQRQNKNQVAPARQRESETDGQRVVTVDSNAV